MVAEGKRHIFELLKKKGAFWSYRYVPGEIPSDDVLMEKGLLFLDFENMPLLFDVYGYDRLKRFWRKNLVSQGYSLNIINYLLAVLFFKVKRPDSYLKRYGRG